MGTVLKEAIKMKDKLEMMAAKATNRNPLAGYDKHDILQAFFVKIIQNEDIFDDRKSAVRTWIYNVFNNMVRDLFRKQSKHKLRFYSPVVRLNTGGQGGSYGSRANPDTQLDQICSKDNKAIQEMYDVSLEVRIAIRFKVYDFLSWLKTHNENEWEVITLMLRHEGNRYHVSLDSGQSVQEINRIVTKVKEYPETKQLLNL